MADLNPLYDPATDNATIADETQKRLNQPLAAQGLSNEDQALLNQILTLVEAGTIQLYTPSSLLNQAVYTTLNSEAQGKADQNAVNMLSKIRDIVNLHKAGMDTTYQVENLVHALRLNKESLEAQAGNVFLI